MRGSRYGSLVGRVSTHACVEQYNEVNMVFQTIEFDPMCDKEHPQKITFEDVSAASFRIQSGIVKTPCVVRYHVLYFYYLSFIFY